MNINIGKIIIIGQILNLDQLKVTVQGKFRVILRIMPLFKFF